MGRRKLELTEVQQRYYRSLHARTAEGRREAIREQQTRSQRSAR
jgi:hypothetical protein